MLRFLAFAVLAFLVFLILRASVVAFLAGVRGGRRPADARAALRDELVKDPVCETYVPRLKAVARTTDGATRYFCSTACADKFAKRA